MANQAAKKAQRAAGDLKTKLQYWIVPIHVLYILYRLVWLYASVTRWTLVGYAFLAGVTYFSFSWVIGAAEEGGSSEYAMDVLIITLFTNAGLLISDYFWLAFLAIPGYLLYLGSGMLKNYIFTPTAEEQEVDDPAAQKKKEKAERRASRPKFKTGR